MSHECEDCGEEFNTLSRLRLHDCSPSKSATTETSSESQQLEEPSNDPSDYGPEPIQIKELDQQLATADEGDTTALTQAVATYESALASADESGSSNRYRRISRTYQERLISALDEATRTEGWEFLGEFIDAYHPDTAEEFPYVTTVLQNVVGRYFIRTRVTEGVVDLPVAGLEFYSSILNKVGGDGYDFINEGVHPYGWGIGHPDHPVSDNIHRHAATDIFVVNPMLEHAFYADQEAAVQLLEEISTDDAIDMTLPHPSGDISETRYLLDAPAGIASDFSPTIPRYWEWQEELDYQVELDDQIEQRIRDLVIENGIDQNLPADWTIADLTL